MKNTARIYLVTLILGASFAGRSAAQSDTQIRAAMRRLAAIRLPAPAQSKALEQSNPKIDRELTELDRDPTTKGIGSPGALVQVELTALDAASAARLRVEVTRQGGNVTGGYGDVVLASVPAGAIAAIGNAAGLVHMSLQPVARPDAQEGGGGSGDLEAALGLKSVHAAGITGKGVRIGIVDFGFLHYNELVTAGKLPRPAATRSFHPSGRMEGDNQVHGTGCAEIVHSVAPEAELVLATISGSEAELRNAVDWMVSQRVRIISFSGGFTAAAHNGHSSLDQFVEDTVRRNRILWVNSAGNSAAEHWMGDASQRDSDGWVRVSIQSGGKLILRPRSPDNQIEILWDDWGPNPEKPAVSHPVNAYLFQADSGANAFRQVAERLFDNRGSSRPVATFAGLEEKQIYALGLRAPGLSRSLRVHVFAKNFELLDPVPEGSLNVPATSSLSLSVGAFNIRTGELEDFSSRGPTDEGRPKPDIGAFDAMRISSFHNGFFGTSASCPHAAGFAALLAQIRPELNGESLRRGMLQFLRPPRPGSPAGSFGAGIPDPEKLGRLIHAPTDRPPISTGARIALPDAFGGPISAEMLDSLRSRRSEFHPFAAKIAVGRTGAYRSGDGLKFAYRSEIESYYVVLYRDPMGAYSVILPSSQRDPVTLAAGKGYVFPEASGDRLTVRPPAGPQDLILICARRKVRLDDMLRVDPGSLKDVISVGTATYEVVP